MGVILTVATTGPIATKSDNPDLPTTPEEIADAVVEAYELGASVAHIHVRDAEQRPTADLAIAKETMDRISERCPILIQLSTGVGMTVSFEDRAKLVDLRPEMATLNPCSMTFGNGLFHNPAEGVRELAAKMRDLGVQPELEIYDTGHLDACLRLRDAGLVPEQLQFSLVLGVQGGMAATADNLMTMVRRLPEDCVWQVIAIGRSNLQLSAIGLALGSNVRAGLEDTLYLRKGELSRGNSPLVERAAILARDLDLQLASVEETRSILKLQRGRLMKQVDLKVDVDGVELYEVADGVFSYIQHDGTWWINNTGFLVGDDGVLSIDACSTQRRTQALLDTIAQVTDAPIRTLVNTHHHGDHTFGNWLFEPSTIVAHRNARPAALSWGAPKSEPYWEQVEWGEFKMSLPNLTFDTSVSLWVGERECIVQHFGVAGHTNNDSVVWIPETGVVFAGDLVFNGGMPFVVQGSVAGARESLARIRELNPTTIVAGHGMPTDTEILDRTDGYLAFLQDAAKQGVAAGVTPLDCARGLDLGEYGEWLDSERFVGNLHRAYIEEQGAPPGAPLDIQAALNDMVVLNGNKPLATHA